jgi:PKD repeat protein
MKKLYFLPLILAFFFISFPAFSQLWVEMQNDPKVNFYTMQQEFNSHWNSRSMEKGKGYKQFRRYEYMAEPRVYPSGDRSLASPAKAYDEFQKYLQTNPEAASSNRNSWTALGPTGAPSGGGAGRTNFLRFDPINPQILYTGAPSGGLWKSIDNGVSWTTATDKLSSIGCSDIAIDYTNTQILYLATGDGDAADTYSIGVLKSTDGGATWNTTGLNWTVTQQRRISKLLIHPTNPLILIAGTSAGIFRTINGGTNWTQVSTATGIKDMEFKPRDPSVVYACSKSFLRSTDNGITWSTISATLPASTSVARMAIAVTPHDSTYVYILAGSSTDNGFLGLYRSTDSGATFTTRSTTPNLLGWNTTGSDEGGQAWYDLAIAASPTNKEDVYIGGVNIWRSTNGGTTWTLNAHWYGGGGKPYVHADIHDLIFLPGSGTTLLSANDGGVFRTTNSGTGWTDISKNLQIAQIYRIGLSTSNASLLITGHQDNGTNRMNNTTWSEIVGGDGMECFIDRTNNNNMYASLYYGDFRRSTNGGGSFTSIVSGLTGNAGWVTPWLQDPVTANTLYAGYNQVFKSTNQGTSWSQIGTISGSGNLVALAVAPSDVQVIYAARATSMFKSINGGTTWTAITTGLPTSSAQITYITVHPTDANRLWVTFSGYSTGNKIFTSINGGSNWTNFSTGLPNLPANCVTFQKGSADGIYIGTDVGVYYRDNTMTSWQTYFTGLPNVIVNELEIYYATGKIRAATYGRGVWECSLFDANLTAPVAGFKSDKTTLCAGTSVQYTDTSKFYPTSWSWTFPGGTPSTSNAQNPLVSYATSGSYTVSLKVANGAGNDSIGKNNYITVTPSPNLEISPASPSICKGGVITITASGADSYTWSPATGLSTTFGSTTNASPVNTANYTVTGTKDGCSSSKSFWVTVNQASKPTITQNSNTLTSSNATSYKWLLNTIATGQTNQSITVSNGGSYTVEITDANGCVAISDPFNVEFTGIDELSVANQFVIRPNPNHGKFEVSFVQSKTDNITLEIKNTLGQVIYNEKIANHTGAFNKSFEINGLSKGIYFISVVNSQYEVVKKMVVME